MPALLALLAVLAPLPQTPLHTFHGDSPNDEFGVAVAGDFCLADIVRTRDALPCLESISGEGLGIEALFISTQSPLTTFRDGAPTFPVTQPRIY